MEPVMKKMEAPVWLASYADVRTDSYVMMASLLQQPPSEELLTLLQNLQWAESIPAKMGDALEALRKAGRNYPVAALEDEFNKLFVGLGSGEMVPYASWYKEKMIQSQPLAALRADLSLMGLVRQEESHELEDHAGALCEIMALISQKANTVSHARQAIFFYEHVAPWMMDFFNDLQSAKCAKFYRAVGLFGSCFLETENEYLKNVAKDQIPITKGGLKK